MVCTLKHSSCKFVGMIRESRQQMSCAGACSFGGDFLEQLENDSNSIVLIKEGTVTIVSVYYNSTKH